MSDDLQTIPGCDLGFIEYNTTKDSTILFCHGALSSPLEGSPVVPYLNDYHILIPDLHKNAKNLPTRPRFSLAWACTQLAILIQHKAKNGKVHVYGHSMGAYVAVELAMSHPELIETVIASGIGLFSHSSWLVRAALPSALYAQTLLPRKVLSKERHAQIINYVMKPTSQSFLEKWVEQPNEGDYALCREIATALETSLPRGKPVNVQARTLIIAGTASPADPVWALKWVVNEIRKTNSEVEGIEIKDGGHPWIIKLPELCALVIQAWIEKKEMPQGATGIDC